MKLSFSSSVARNRPVASFRRRVADALTDRYLQISLSRAANILNHARSASYADVPASEALRSQARSIREHTLARLADYLEQLEIQARGQGIHVYWAEEAADANRYIVELARKHGVFSVARGGESILRELDLDRVLREAALEIHPTTVGDFMLTLTNRPPGHLVFSSLQVRKEEISQSFPSKLDIPATLDIGSMTSTAAARIRANLIQADMAISGLTFAVAETGSLILAENQGNERLLSNLPRLHVLVMGLERVVPTLEDLLLLLQAQARSGRGQPFAAYTTLLNRVERPVQSATPDRSEVEETPREIHLVLLDNGRSRMLQQASGAVLTCIQCGACLNACPVYREIGGEAYGWTYMGPIGAVLAPLSLGIERAASLPGASTGCGACRQVCPVDLDLPSLLHDLRVRASQERRVSVRLRLARRLWRWSVQDNNRYQQATRILRWVLRPWARQGLVQSRLPLLRRWTATQPLPAPARQSFREWWKQR